MFLVPSAKPKRRKGTEMQVVLEFSPLGFSAGLLKLKLFLQIPRFCQHLHFCLFKGCCVWSVLGRSRCLSCWTENGLRQSPSTEQTGSSFPHILPRQIIQIVPYSSCTFSLSNEDLTMSTSGCFQIFIFFFQNFNCFI